MRRTLIALVGSALICTSSYSQYEIPVLTKEKARLLLQEIWPRWAMESEIVTGIPVQLPDTVLVPRGRLTIASVTDSLVFTLNDTIRDAVFAYPGAIITRTALTTGDSLRNLLIRLVQPNVAVVAWLPKQYLWDDTQADSMLSLLHWGITTISYTDSNFWKFHEREVALLEALQTPAMANLYERVTKVVAADQIDMEAGSIFISYNNTTKTLTYLRRKL